jgi:hypothetical protein
MEVMLQAMLAFTAWRKKRRLSSENMPGFSCSSFKAEHNGLLDEAI